MCLYTSIGFKEGGMFAYIISNLIPQRNGEATRGTVDI